MLLVSSLEYGGTERQVVYLANNLDPDRFDVTVCSLSKTIPLAQHLRDSKKILRVVEKKGRFDLSAVWRVARLIRRLRIELVHAFLFDAEIVSRLATRLSRGTAVIASERNADYQRPPLHTLCLRLTDSWFDAMIANSHAGRHFNIKTLGIAKGRIRVVHNGVDVQRFRPMQAAPCRKRLSIPTTCPVVGMVASFKPQKNHMMFLRMARCVLQRIPNALFLCAGDVLLIENGDAAILRSGTRMHRASTAYHRRIANAIRALGLSDRCRLLGNCADIVSVYNACDLTVLTSHHEGTPNVVLESMACGVPVVATDVADNAYVLPGEGGGTLVCSDDHRAMSEKVCELLLDPQLRLQKGRAARCRAEEEFSLSALARKTQAVYRKVVQGAACRTREFSMATPVPDTVLCDRAAESCMSPDYSFSPSLSQHRHG